MFCGTMHTLSNVCQIAWPQSFCHKVSLFSFVKCWRVWRWVPALSSLGWIPVNVMMIMLSLGCNLFSLRYSLLILAIMWKASTTTSQSWNEWLNQDQGTWERIQLYLWRICQHPPISSHSRLSGRKRKTFKHGRTQSWQFPILNRNEAAILRNCLCVEERYISIWKSPGLYVCPYRGQIYTLRSINAATWKRRI